MNIIKNFYVFEGGDGSGTTTQISLLAKRIKNIDFYPTFEPTDGQIGRIIRSALKKEIVIKPQTLALLFAADRNEHLYGADGILAQVDKGCLVISDRYALSSLVYQGIECGDELPGLLNSGFPAPELTFFLDIEPETAISRMKDRSSLEIYEYLDFQKKVREKYLSLIKGYKARVEIIDASKSASEVEDQVWNILRQMPIFNI
ncbi:MAG: dTMP kinase [Treponema sp.]|nr:dTMP kinase [Treponema sp.]